MKVYQNSDTPFFISSRKRLYISADPISSDNSKKEILKVDYLTFRILVRAEDGTQTRDPQLGRLMLYQLSYFRNFKWAKMDSNHRRHKPADLQSAPFGHSGICPIAFEIHRFITFVSQLRCKDTTIFVNSKRNPPFLLHKLHFHRLYCPICPLHAPQLAPLCWS